MVENPGLLIELTQTHSAGPWHALAMSTWAVQCQVPTQCQRSIFPVSIKRKQLGVRRVSLNSKRRRVVQASAEPEASAPEWALLVENDGVLVDVHADCHRVAFNQAFSQLGLDCAHWTAPVYWDLLRAGDGSAQGLVAAWFGTVGWPTALATSDRRQFAVKIDQIKQQNLNNMIMDGKVPLRKGVREFLDEADADGAALAIITSTASGAEKIAVATSAALGDARTAKWPFFDCYQQPGWQERDSDEAEGSGSTSLHQSLHKRQAQLKHNAAADFVRSMEGAKWGERAVSIGLDPAMMAALKRAGMIQPEWLAAIASTLGAPVGRRVMIAANNATMQCAQAAGMHSIAVPPSLSARGIFPAADLQFDSFGHGGGCTWARLKSMLSKQNLGGAKGSRLRRSI